jgi:hypothetical protein
VRFIGVTRELTHVYTLVRNAHGDAIAREIRNGTMRILEIVERALVWGRSHYSHAGKFDGADSAILDADVAWEGLDKQIRKGNNDASAKAKAFTGYGAEEDVIRDIRGDVLDADLLEDAARVVGENFGTPSLMLLDTKAHADLGRQFFPKERINPMGIAQGKAGFVLQSFVSSAGEFQLMSSVFMRPKRSVPAPLQGIAAPGALTVTKVASDPDSKFTAADAGDYSYIAAAVTEAGEGAPSAQATITGVVAGDRVEVAIPAVTGAIAYAVYRAPKNSITGHEFIGYVAPAAVGGSATLKDLNHKLPGLSQAYLLTKDAEVIRFKQLAPLMKMDLAVIATAYRWAQLLYGTPIVYAPRKNFIIDNIGRSA